MNFESLVGRINQVQDMLQAQAAHAINLAVTARNWLVGFYIVEFEQHGEDRAKYGENLLKNLAKRLNRRGLGERRLYEFRLIYIADRKISWRIHRKKRCGSIFWKAPPMPTGRNTGKRKTIMKEKNNIFAVNNPKRTYQHRR